MGCFRVWSAIKLLATDGKNTYRNQTIHTINEASLIPVLVASIQELHGEIEQLKKEIEQLKK
ncbi:MAG: hypothetical protein WKI04_17545 [Ferruginibacter sp.]